MSDAMNKALHWSRRFSSPNKRSIALILLIIAAFVLGGGARADIASLVILRPAAFLLLAYAILCMSGHDLVRFRFMWIFAVLVVALTASHLIPLPPSVWSELPGRDLFAQVDRVAGLGQVWRPIAPVPAEAWNALFSLVVPISALALVSMQRIDVSERVLLTLICIGAVSILLGLLQLLGPSQGPFYFYRITNAESPVGLFANRNHHATFLAVLLPVLAVWGRGGRAPRRGQRDMRPFRQLLAFVIGTLALIFVLVSGSRAGLVLGLAALIATPFVIGTPIRELFRPSPLPGKAAGWQRLVRHWRLGVALAMTLLLALVLIMGAATQTMTRFADNEEGRPDMWRAAWELTKAYFPVGSGAGSFVDVYKLGEPYERLSERYLNHAHNDLIETIMTMGLPGALLIAILLIALAGSFPRLWRGRADKFAPRVEARLGFTVLSLLLLASLVDYPLRTPALAVMFVVSSTWLSSDSRRSRLEPRAAGELR